MKSKFLITAFTVLFVQASSFCQNIPYRQADKWGLSDLNGNLVLQPEYDSIEFIIPHIFKARIWKDHKIGMIDGNGKEIVPPVYDNAVDHYKYVRVIKNQKEGIFNLQGKIILPVEYSALEPTSFNFIILTKDNKKGIGRFVKNKVVIKQTPAFDNIKLLYPENIFECKRKGVKHYLDTLLRPVKFQAMEVETIAAPEGAYASFQQLDRMYEEEKITPASHQDQDITIMRDASLFKVVYERKNGKWGVRKLDGTILVPYQYEDLDLENTDLQDIHSGYRQLYVLKLNGKWGMIGHKNRDASRYTDTTTYHLIDFKYDHIKCNVNCTYYLLQDNQKVGIVSAKDFSKTVEPKYLYIRDTYNEIQNASIFLVKTVSGKCGYINENGTEYFTDN